MTDGVERVVILLLLGTSINFFFEQSFYENEETGKKENTSLAVPGALAHCQNGHQGPQNGQRVLERFLGAPINFS